MHHPGSTASTGNVVLREIRVRLGAADDSRAGAASTTSSNAGYLRLLSDADMDSGLERMVEANETMGSYGPHLDADDGVYDLYVSAAIQTRTSCG